MRSFGRRSWKRFERGRGAYGTVRVHQELIDQGSEIGRRRVARLMAEMGLAGLPERKFQTTTDSNHDKPIVANVLDRDIKASRPNEKWVTDIT
jgi:putative transposase